MKDLAFMIENLNCAVRLEWNGDKWFCTLIPQPEALWGPDAQREFGGKTLKEAVALAFAEARKNI